MIKPGQVVKPIEYRFYKYISHCNSSGCWIWSGSKTKKGYGQIFCPSGYGQARIVSAHRVAMFLANGEFPPKDMFVCHHCDNPSCVNPRHLYIGTRADNVKDAVERGRLVGRKTCPRITACKRGHDFSGDNVHIRADGSRACKACAIINMNKNSKKRSERRLAARIAKAKQAEAYELLREAIARVEDQS